MALELLVAEARDLPEDSIMEVVRVIREIKSRSQHSTLVASSPEPPIIREAGKYRGQIVMSDDFDEPLDDFKEYM